MDKHAFGTLMSALDPPLAVVTVAAAGERAGCLVGFHAQSSIDPERYCVWLSKANRTYEVALRASHLAVHFLAEDQLPLAELFGGRSGDTVDKFAGLEVTDGPGAAPLLAGCPRWLAARRGTLIDDGGDHVAVLTEPVDAQASGPFRPLRTAQAAHIQPGHGFRERHDLDA
ncbi:MAG TPA: flavin reductase family protein [Streptosporangiaceae bacterium]|nr:flavin reductase family protein [Streptosporangiaceae bacterium]